MRLAVAAALLVALRAEAHLGATVATAAFSSPAGPTLTLVDGGYRVAPFVPTTVDGAATIAWNDGDVDPTGRFTFYYLDHAPVAEVQPSDIPQLATPIAGGDGIWVSCTCGPPASCGDDAGARRCDNALVWDTSALAPGSYYIIALNNDPPYQIYSVSDGPVRVVHGGATPGPAVVVLRPDGVGAYDTSYRAQWLAVGAGLLRIDLSWGYNEFGLALNPPTPLASDVQAIANGDGTQSWDWDLSSLASGERYSLRVRATDGLGRTAFSDARLALAVLHAAPSPSPDFAVSTMAAPTDLSVAAVEPADLAVAPSAIADAAAVDAVAPRPVAGGCQVATGPPPLPLALALALLARICRRALR
jgi:hypothetical protein